MNYFKIAAGRNPVAFGHAGRFDGFDALPASVSKTPWCAQLLLRQGMPGANPLTIKRPTPAQATRYAPNADAVGRPQ
jgi:hypothetical protein